MAEPYSSEPPDCSEDELAARFVNEFRERIRYEPTRSDWWYWDNSCWRAESRGWVLEQIRHICRKRANTLRHDQGSRRLARKLASSATMSAVERIASRDPRIVVSEDQFDSFPQLLNTPAGPVDLTSGVRRAHDARHLLTKLTAVSPAPQVAECPNWKQLLDRWMESDPDRVAHLQRISGYCLSGETDAQVAFILCGPNADGPRTFLEILRLIGGDYVANARIEMFLRSSNPRHPTELTQLIGKRLVTAVEADRDAHWDMSRLREIVAGGQITARYMYGNFFEFQSTAKLMLQSTHLPSLEFAGDAARSLFHLVPFSDSGRSHSDCMRSLRGEAGSILRWALTGFRSYLKTGLAPPPAVIAETNQYIEFSDPFAAWLAECCTDDRNAFTSTAALFQSWQRSCARSGEKDVRSKRSLSLQLQARGYRHEANRRPRGFYGLKLQHQKGIA